MKIFLASMAIILVAGCSTVPKELRTYLDVPTTCEELDREMVALAGWDAKVHTGQQVVGNAAIGLGYAAGAGAVPSALSYLPGGVGVAQSALNAADTTLGSVGTNGNRIEYLAYARLHMNCPPLHINEEPAKPGPLSGDI